MKRFLLMFLFCCGWALGGQSQDTLGINVDTVVITPNPVILDSNFTLTVFVENRSNSFYNDSFTVFAATDSNGFTDIIASVLGVDSLAAFQTSPITFTIDASAANNMASGGNGVSIWPEAPPGTGYVSDTSVIEVIVVDPAGVEEPKWTGYAALRLYPNPATEWLLLNFNGQPINAEQVRINDLSGRLLSLQRQVDRIDLSAIDRGIYLVTVRLSGDRTKTFRIVRL
ncbi:MAG: T9SS type A sorting domain-containing protein [Bacteroidota bacterium]